MGSNAYTSTAYAPLASPTFTGTVTIPTPFTLGAVSVTSTGAQLNYLSAATGTTGSSNLVYSNSPTFVTPALGTPASGVATNLTGLPLTTGVTGVLPIANGGTGSNTQNFVDLTTVQTAGGAKTWSALGTFNAGITSTGGTINLNASLANATNIGNGTNNLIQLGTIDINQTGTADTRIGNTTGNVTIDGGTGPSAIQIGNGATQHGISIGSGSGISNVLIGSKTVASTTVIQGGDGAAAIKVDPNAAGGIVIGSSTGTGAITVGSSTAAQTVNIGSGTGASTVNVANGTAGNTVSIAGGNSAVADVVNIGTGLVGGAGSKTINIANGASTTGINTVNIGTGATTVAGGNTIHIGDGTPVGGTNLVTIGSNVGASATTVQAGTGYITIKGKIKTVQSGAAAVTAAESGAGVPTLTANSNDVAGKVTSSNVNHTTITITFPATYTNAPFAVVTPANAAAATITGSATSFYVTTTATTLVINMANSNTVSAWYYHVFGN